MNKYRVRLTTGGSTTAGIGTHLCPLGARDSQPLIVATVDRHRAVPALLVWAFVIRADPWFSHRLVGQQGALSEMIIVKRRIEPCAFTYSNRRRQKNCALSPAIRPGSKLPENHGPWTVTGVVAAENAPPHNFSCEAIEEAIEVEGFQLWRLRRKISEAPASGA
jgi:hypothetical protein